MYTKRKTRLEGVAHWGGASWSHRIRILNDDGSTTYTRRSGFATKEEAEESFYRYEEEYKKSCRKREKRNGADSSIGFIDYLKYWLEEEFALRVENTTLMISSYVLYNLILPNIEEDIKLKFVNTDYLDKLLEAVAPICESAGNKSRELLNQAMKDAIIQGLIRTNPVAGTKTYPRKKPKVMVLGKKNIKILLNSAVKCDWYLEILLALFMGLRKGEILGLKFGDIYYDDKGDFYYINIRRQITSNPIVEQGTSNIESCGIVEKEPKSETSYRKLRIPAAVYDEITVRRHKIDERKDKMGEDYADGDYVSAQKNGLPHTVSAMNSALSRLCYRNGLPHVTVHGLRHMYATILIEQGVPLAKVSAALGHSSINTTFEYYADMMDEDERVVSFMNDTFTVNDITEGDDTR